MQVQFNSTVWNESYSKELKKLKTIEGIQKKSKLEISWNKIQIESTLVLYWAES